MPPLFGAAWDSLDSKFGSSLKDPWLILGDVCPNVSNPKMILYKFITSHINFIENEHVRLNETCLDTQGHFKENLLNIMNIPGLLTSKFYRMPIYAIITHLRTL